jgi:hypothetical protein
MLLTSGAFTTSFVSLIEQWVIYKTYDVKVITEGWIFSLFYKWEGSA